MIDYRTTAASSQERPRVKACSTCAHFRNPGTMAAKGACLAFGGTVATDERRNKYGLCGPEGRAWEPRPPSIWQRIVSAWRRP